MALKNLDDDNAERSIELDAMYDKPNGRKCPKCGAELVDDRTPPPNSVPPQINTRCDNCKQFTGSRVVVSR